MLLKVSIICLKQYITGYENTNTHHAILFNYFEFGTQASDLLDMSQFHKISIAKCSYRKRTEKIVGFPGADEQNVLNR